MKDGFEETFIVELEGDAVWETIASRTTQRESDSDDEVHYVLPGFPSFVPQKVSGASATLIELDAGRLLRVRKDDEPCAGTEIAVTLEAVDQGTRITIVQSGFGPWLDRLRDTFQAHWTQIVADFRLYIERGLTVPGTAWSVGLGAQTQETQAGLEIVDVEAGGFGEKAGMEPGDLLLTLRDLRVHDTKQLWTILALTQPGDSAEVTWARGRERMHGKAAF